jgi:hypothetical protein
LFTFLPKQDLTRELIVTIRKDIGFYGHGLAYNALDRESAAVDLRLNSLDHYSVPAFCDWHRWLSQRDILLGGSHR